MPNGSAGAGKRADYSGLADRQTRRRPGPSPSRWPRLIPSRIAPEILLRDSGPRPRQRAYAVSRPVRAYGQVVLSVNGLSERCDICVRYSLRSDIHRALLRQNSEERGKKKIQRRREVRMVIPDAANSPGVDRRSFLPPAPCLRTRAGGLFCETGTPPGRESHSMCAN